MAIFNLGRVAVKPRGVWSASVADYKYLETVRYQGAGYMVNIPTGFVPSGTLPTNTDYFDKVVDKGDKGDKGDMGSPGTGKIPFWIAQTYPIGSQVLHLGKSWTTNAATVAGDVPGTSPKWVEDLTGYATLKPEVLDIYSTRHASSHKQVFEFVEARMKNEEVVKLNESNLTRGTYSATGATATAADRVRTAPINVGAATITITPVEGYQIGLTTRNADNTPIADFGWQTGVASFAVNSAFTILIKRVDGANFQPSALPAGFSYTYKRFLDIAKGTDVDVANTKDAVSGSQVGNFMDAKGQAREVLLNSKNLSLGSYTIPGGAKSARNDRFRTNLINVGKTTVTLTIPQGYEGAITTRNADMTMIVDYEWQPAGVFFLPVNNPFTIVLRKPNDEDISGEPLPAGFKYSYSDFARVATVFDRTNERDAVTGKQVSDFVGSSVGADYADKYTGEKVEVAGRKFARQLIFNVGSLSGIKTGSQQGFDIHNNIGFMLYDEGKVNVIDMLTQTLLGAFNFSDTINNHCNNANFGNEFPVGNPAFPALYVSEFYGANRCLVESVTTSGATLIQTFSLAIVNNPIYECNWTIDKENKCIWIVGFKLPSWRTTSGNGLYYAKVRLPLLSEGNITFTDADVIERFEMPYVVGQGTYIRDNKMYAPNGLPPNCKMFIINLVTKQIVTRIDIAKYNQEPEGVTIWNDELYVTSNVTNGLIHRYLFK